MLLAPGGCHSNLRLQDDDLKPAFDASVDQTVDQTIDLLLASPGRSGNRHLELVRESRWL